MQDNKDFFEKSCNILENVEVFISFEVIAEVVYVLQKVYNVPKSETCYALHELLMYENISVLEKNVMTKALDLFKDNNLDFVDCILCAYKKVKSDEIETFDKRLIKCITEN